MQDNTYLPRNFATLGLLRIQQPVFMVYRIKEFFSLHKLGQEALRIHHNLFKRTVVFVVNSCSVIIAEFLLNDYLKAINKNH